MIGFILTHSDSGCLLGYFTSETEGSGLYKKEHHKILVKLISKIRSDSPGYFDKALEFKDFDTEVESLTYPQVLKLQEDVQKFYDNDYVIDTCKLLSLNE